MILSEYGIAAVDQPVHLNRILRRAGLLAIREEMGGELLDAGASTALPVGADHQVAHIYINDAKRIEEVRRIVAAVHGVERMLDRAGQASEHLDRPRRSGELVAISCPRGVVHVLLLAGSFAPAGFCDDRRYSPQAGV